MTPVYFDDCYRDPRRRRISTVLWPLALLAFLIAIAIVAASFIAGEWRTQGERVRQAEESIEKMRARFMETGFCPACGDSRWQAKIAPKPCNVCNPRGSLEVGAQVSVGPKRGAK